jgi:hypothetical protein
MKHGVHRRCQQQSLPGFDETAGGLFSIRTDFAASCLSLDKLSAWYKTKIEGQLSGRQILILDSILRALSDRPLHSTFTLQDIRNAALHPVNRAQRGIGIPRKKATCRSLSDNPAVLDCADLSTQVARLAELGVLDVLEQSPEDRKFRVRHEAFEEWYRFRVLGMKNATTPGAFSELRPPEAFGP